MNKFNEIEKSMAHQPMRLAKVLTYLGTLPFLFAVFIALSPLLSLPEFLGGDIVYSGFKAMALIHSYAVVILSFLAGIQWGISLHDPKQNMFLLFSNVFAILAWLSLMVFASKLALSVLLIGFIGTLLVDRNAYRKQLIPEWFWQLRKKASLIVCVALLIVILTV